MAKKQDTISIGFEEKIWKAADILRGSLDASQYKGVVLGLIFLKYISDRFDQKFQELQGDEYADPEDKDEYTAENIFYVPAEARWSKISAAAHTPQIGVVIDEALTAIERENDRLKNVLPGNFARPELPKNKLGEVVDLFTNIEMHDAGEEKDLLGRAYEYCLQKFASQEGKNAGEFYTPSCIVRTLVEILEPYEGRVFDPCCGSGGMFVQSAKFIDRHKGNLRKISIYGQESNPTTWRLAAMNLALRGIDFNLGREPAQQFTQDIREGAHIGGDQDASGPGSREMRSPVEPDDGLAGAGRSTNARRSRERASDELGLLWMKEGHPLLDGLGEYPLEKSIVHLLRTEQGLLRHFASGHRQHRLGHCCHDRGRGVGLRKQGESAR